MLNNQLVKSSKKNNKSIRIMDCFSLSSKLLNNIEEIEIKNGLEQSYVLGRFCFTWKEWLKWIGQEK